MVEEPEEDKKLGLAASIARGVSIRRWADANGVCARTAQRWAKEALVRTEAQAIRRQMLDEFIGAMASRSGLVVKGISALAQDALSGISEACSAQGDPGANGERRKVLGTRRAHCRIRGRAPP